MPNHAEIPKSVELSKDVKWKRKQPETAGSSQVPAWESHVANPSKSGAIPFKKNETAPESEPISDEIDPEIESHKETLAKMVKEISKEQWDVLYYFNNNNGRDRGKHILNRAHNAFQQGNSEHAKTSTLYNSMKELELYSKGIYKISEAGADKKSEVAHIVVDVHSTLQEDLPQGKSVMPQVRTFWKAHFEPKLKELGF